MAGSSMYVRKYGKDMIQEALKSSLKRDVVLGNVYYAFPFYFVLRAFKSFSGLY